MPDRVGVMFCCNDGYHGTFTGRCDFLDIEGEDVRLSAPIPAPRLVQDVRPGVLRFSRCVFRHHGWRYGVGNWCWDRAWMDVSEARRLIRYALERGFHAEEWPCDGPWAELFRKVEAPHA
jgi:hypothetical protein